MSGGTSQAASRTALIALGIAALFGVAVAGGSVFKGAGTEATTRDALPYAALGAALALALAAIAFVAHRRLAADRPRPGWAPVLAGAFIAAILGSLIGTALTPRSPTADQVSPLDDDEIERRSETLDLDPGTVVRPVDFDGDGEPDLDANGDPILAYDEDGDGVIDGYLQPCPEPTTETGSVEVGWTTSSAAPLDVECDGEIDRYLELDPTPFTSPSEAAPAPDRSPVTIPPDERAERVRDEGAAGRFGSFLRAALIALTIFVALAAIFVAWQRRRRAAADEEPDEPPPSTADSDIEQPIAATIDAMERVVDPRQAICEAYGTLLAELAAIGLPRRPEEGPGEHVRRCLHRADLDQASVNELVDLFTMARFSTHPVTELHREAALRYLRRSVPTDLVAATTAPTWAPPSGPRP